MTPNLPALALPVNLYSQTQWQKGRLARVYAMGSHMKCKRNKLTWIFNVYLVILKRKKRLEQQLTQIDNTLTTIEFQREALQNARSNAEILKTMQTASKAMKTVFFVAIKFTIYILQICYNRFLEVQKTETHRYKAA